MLALGRRLGNWLAMSSRTAELAVGSETEIESEPKHHERRNHVVDAENLARRGLVSCGDISDCYDAISQPTKRQPRCGAS